MRRIITLNLSGLSGRNRRAVSTAAQMFAFNLGYRWASTVPESIGKVTHVEEPMLVFEEYDDRRVIFYSSNPEASAKDSSRIMFDASQLVAFFDSLIGPKVSVTATIDVPFINLDGCWIIDESEFQARIGAIRDGAIKKWNLS